MLSPKSHIYRSVVSNFVSTLCKKCAFEIINDAISVCIKVDIITMISDHGPFNDHNVGLIRRFMEIDARCINSDHPYGARVVIPCFIYTSS